MGQKKCAKAATYCHFSHHDLLVRCRHVPVRESFPSERIFSIARRRVSHCRVGSAHRREPPPARTVGGGHPTIWCFTPPRGSHGFHRRRVSDKVIVRGRFAASSRIRSVAVWGRCPDLLAIPLAREIIPTAFHASGTSLTVPTALPQRELCHASQSRLDARRCIDVVGGDPVSRHGGLAAPPQITKMALLGVRRGNATEVTVSGSNLAGSPRLIAPFAFRIDPLPAAVKSDAANWRIKLVVAAEVAVGVYPVRIQTDDGISNPFLLAVGQLPQVEEKEENSTFETAQMIPDPPVVVEGQVAANDVDFFRFHGKKGQLIVVDAECAQSGSGVDPTLRLTSGAATRAYIASADDSPGLLTDARMTATLPADGDYVVELSDLRYQGATGRFIVW